MAFKTHGTSLQSMMEYLLKADIFMSTLFRKSAGSTEEMYEKFKQDVRYIKFMFNSNKSINVTLPNANVPLILNQQT